MSRAGIMKTLWMFVILGSASFGMQARACTMSHDSRTSYFSTIEPAGGTNGMFVDMAIRERRPTLIDRCQANSGKFLMLALGSRTTRLHSDARDRSYDGTLIDDQCSLSHPLIPRILNFSQKEAYFKQQFQHLRSCTDLIVTELNGRPLLYPEDQKNCKVTPLGTGKIQMRGDACFLKIQPYYSLAVGVQIRPECHDRESLLAKKLNPRDLDLALDAYVAGDDSGMSTELDAIGSSQVRYVLSPPSTLLPLTEYLAPELPRFPATTVADIHMGPLRIRPVSEGRTEIMLSLNVDNYGKIKCAGGFCASEADFTQTVAGEARLYEITPRKRVLVDSWMYGNTLPAQWQGILHGLPYVSEGTEIKKNARYELEFTVTDPSEEWELFMTQLPQYLIDLKKTEGTAGIDVIAPLSSFSHLVPLQSIASLPQLSGQDISQVMQKAIDLLQSFKISPDWPPFYTRWCETASGKCRGRGRDKFLLKLTTAFSAKGLNEDGTLHLQDFTVRRESPVFNSYQRSVHELPGVRCP